MLPPHLTNAQCDPTRFDSIRLDYHPQLVNRLLLPLSQSRSREFRSTKLESRLGFDSSISIHFFFYWESSRWFVIALVWFDWPLLIEGNELLFDLFNDLYLSCWFVHWFIFLDESSKQADVSVLVFDVSKMALMFSFLLEDENFLIPIYGGLITIFFFFGFFVIWSDFWFKLKIPENGKIIIVVVIMFMHTI